MSGRNNQASLFIIRLNPVDLLTLSGAFLSMTAIGLVLRHQFADALAVLYLAVIADAFDGVLARKFKLERNFGRYLDGFVDCIDYLITPAIFMYVWGFDSTLDVVILMAFVGCGIIRLSVFNEIGNVKSENDTPAYLGAPVFWSALLLGPIYLSHVLIGRELTMYLCQLAMPAYSLAMLHNAKYHKFENPKLMLACLMAFSLTFFMLGRFNALTRFVGEGMHQWLAYNLVLSIAVIFPVVIAGVLHMACVAKNAFSWSAIPINHKLFGPAKTLRGFVLMPLFTSVGFLATLNILDHFGVRPLPLAGWDGWLLGLLIGAGYVLFELPNSALKRAMGIRPGELPEQRKWLFVAIDQLDSILGCALILYYFIGFSFEHVAFLVVMSFASALAVKRMLFGLGLKATGR